MIKSKAQRVLPVKIYKMIQSLQAETTPYLAEVIVRHKAGCTLLPSWQSERKVDYYVGLLHANYMQIEALMNAYGCYLGYRDDKRVTTCEIKYAFEVRVYTL